MSTPSPLGLSKLSLHTPAEQLHSLSQSHWESFSKSDPVIIFSPRLIINLVKDKTENVPVKSFTWSSEWFIFKATLREAVPTESSWRTKLGPAQSHQFFSSSKRANGIPVTFRQLWKEVCKRKAGAGVVAEILSCRQWWEKVPLDNIGLNESQEKASCFVNLIQTVIPSTPWRMAPTLGTFPFPSSRSCHLQVSPGLALRSNHSLGEISVNRSPFKETRKAANCVKLISPLFCS